MARAQIIEVLKPAKGLKYDDPGTTIPKEFSTSMQNVRLKSGVVVPTPGYSTHGSPYAVLGIPLLIVEYVENDEDRHLLCFTTKYIYEYSSTLNNWAKIDSRQLVLADCDSNWTASANVTSATDATTRVVGASSVALTIAAAFTTGIAGYFNFAAKDTTTYSHIHFWIRSSVTTSSGDLRIAIDNTNNCASPLTYYTVPALTANTWTQVEVAIGSGSNAAVLSGKPSGANPFQPWRSSRQHRQRYCC